jgi:hypothetical protein
MAQSINSFPVTDQATQPVTKAMQVFQLRICLLNAEPVSFEVCCGTDLRAFRATCGEFRTFATAAN